MIEGRINGQDYSFVGTNGFDENLGEPFCGRSHARVGFWSMPKSPMRVTWHQILGDLLPWNWGRRTRRSRPHDFKGSFLFRVNR